MSFSTVKSSARKFRRRALAGAALCAFFATHAAFALEQKSFVVSWVTQAVYSQDGDCPQGIEPATDGLYSKILVNQFGKKPEEAAKLMESFNEGQNGKGGSFESAFNNQFIYRGRLNGAPVNVYDNPTSVPDPKIGHVVGKYAPGFNLDGKVQPDSFEDPVTHEKGVDNQYFRVMGCFGTHRAVPPHRPTHWAYSWDAQRAAMRAWIITLSGADLSKDGDVTVTFDKALEAVMLDATSNVTRDQTFRIDPDPRSHNVFQGKIVNHVLTVTPGRLQLVGDPFVIPIWDVRDTHLRLTLNADGTLDGVMGGYQKWLPIYYTYAQGGFLYEAMVGLNLPGIYYSLRQFADADPDAATGQNTAISTAYRVEAVPALTVAAQSVSSTRRDAH